MPSSGIRRSVAWHKFIDGSEKRTDPIFA